MLSRGSSHSVSVQRKPEAKFGRVVSVGGFDDTQEDDWIVSLHAHDPLAPADSDTVSVTLGVYLHCPASFAPGSRASRGLPERDPAKFDIKFAKSFDPAAFAHDEPPSDVLALFRADVKTPAHGPCYRARKRVVRQGGVQC